MRLRTVSEQIENLYNRYPKLKKDLTELNGQMRFSGLTQSIVTPDGVIEKIKDEEEVGNTNHIGLYLEAAQQMLTNPQAMRVPAGPVTPMRVKDEFDDIDDSPILHEVLGWGAGPARIKVTATPTGVRKVVQSVNTYASVEGDGKQHPRILELNQQFRDEEARALTKQAKTTTTTTAHIDDDDTEFLMDSEFDTGPAEGDEGESNATQERTHDIDEGGEVETVSNTANNYFMGALRKENPNYLKQYERKKFWRDVSAFDSNGARTYLPNFYWAPMHYNDIGTTNPPSLVTIPVGTGNSARTQYTVTILAIEVSGVYSIFNWDDDDTTTTPISKWNKSLRIIESDCLKIALMLDRFPTVTYGEDVSSGPYFEYPLMCGPAGIFDSTPEISTVELQQTSCMSMRNLAMASRYYTLKTIEVDCKMTVPWNPATSSTTFTTPGGSSASINMNAFNNTATLSTAAHSATTTITGGTNVATGQSGTGSILLGTASHFNSGSTTTGALSGITAPTAGNPPMMGGSMTVTGLAATTNLSGVGGLTNINAAATTGTIATPATTGSIELTSGHISSTTTTTDVNKMFQCTQQKFHMYYECEIPVTYTTTAVSNNAGTFLPGSLPTIMKNNIFLMFVQNNTNSIIESGTNQRVRASVTYQARVRYYDGDTTNEFEYSFITSRAPRGYTPNRPKSQHQQNQAAKSARAQRPSTQSQRHRRRGSTYQ